MNVIWCFSLLWHFYLDHDWFDSKPRVGTVPTTSQFPPITSYETLMTGSDDYINLHWQGGLCRLVFPHVIFLSVTHDCCYLWPGFTARSIMVKNFSRSQGYFWELFTNLLALYTREKKPFCSVVVKLLDMTGSFNDICSWPLWEWVKGVLMPWPVQGCLRLASQG